MFLSDVICGERSHGGSQHDQGSDEVEACQAERGHVRALRGTAEASGFHCEGKALGASKGGYK